VKSVRYTTVREGVLHGVKVYRVYLAGKHVAVAFSASEAEVRAGRIEAGARALVQRIKAKGKSERGGK